ncbi:cobalamin-dependent protein [Methanobacterium sp.]|uniref:cobalamin-dependent protein n=1 Tax=Methanobacterium sp. TaxID=2164 RepID=UPI0025DDB15D|nr:cobalamin-dependent protein [Methanobacterium sp.]MBI5458976.1 cobalamin B12-binding domain-containing protein [Methanobacterium sp.]
MKKNLSQDKTFKKVLLIQPNFPIPKKSHNHKDFLPIGLLKLASYYKNKGYEVKLNRLNSNFKSNIDHFNFKPDLILITSLFTYWSKYVKEAVTFCKIHFPTAKIVVGGIYASLMPEHCRKYTGCDDVFVGVCEDAEDFEPDYSLVNVDYQILHTSRGCIRKCSCCGVYEIEPTFKYKKSIRESILKREKSRKKDIQIVTDQISIKTASKINKLLKNVMDREVAEIVNNILSKEITKEIEKINRKKSAKIIFYDNNLLANSHIKEILEELVELKKQRIILNCESQSGFDGRILLRSPELGVLLKKANFINPKIAWDGPFSDKEKIKRQIDILIDSGYQDKYISVFMIFNHDLSFDEMERKRIQCWEWNVQITDCRFRPLDQTFDNYNPYVKKPQSRKDYYIHPGWNDKLVRLFRSNIRKHNICVRQDILYYSADIERKRIKKEKASKYKKMVFDTAKKYVSDAWDPSVVHYDVYPTKTSK